MFNVFNMDDNKKIGTIVLGISVAFYFLGILLFFDRALLMLSNILFLVGFYLLVGFFHLVTFFGKKIKGSVGFFCGMFLIIIGIKFIGVVLQLYGIFQYFYEFGSRLLVWAQNWPVIGMLISKFDSGRTMLSKKSDTINIV